MTFLPRMIKVCSVLCTVLLGFSVMLAPTAPALALAQSAPINATMIAVTETAAPTAQPAADDALSDDQVSDLLDDIVFSDAEDEKPSEQPSAKASLTVNTFCRGYAVGQTYDGLWKKAGATKAKCKEGASGSPGANIIRTTCNIVPLNGPIIYNATVVGSSKCQKL